jgi:putative redox protein
MRSERIEFPNARGDTLAARLDRPDAGDPHAFALFAHCFTCSKDSHAARRIAMALARRGIATLRFDFTGLGGSGGDFANTHFSSNLDDLGAAIAFLRGTGRAPTLLVGHSLGGAAVIAAAARAPEVRAVATVGAPHDVGHVVHQFGGQEAAVRDAGEAVVQLGGRPFTVRRAFLEDVAGHSLDEHLARLGRALLILHAATDQTVGIENAGRLFAAAKHPKSFVSLDRADHLLTDPADAAYVADVIAAWAARYLPAPAAPEPRVAAAGQGVVTVCETRASKFEAEVVAGPHRWIADEPASSGGGDAGPGPYDLLLAALGACTTMTLRMYAERKGLPLDRVSVTLRHGRVHAQDCAECEGDGPLLEVIDKTLALEGALSEEQREKLIEISKKCPVHRTLEARPTIRTALDPPG